MWLALRGRQWTADRRQQHGLDANENCFLWDQEPETINHIIVTCSFSQQIWWNVATAIRQSMASAQSGSILEWWSTWCQH
jgi:hypothetical protein